MEIYDSNFKNDRLVAPPKASMLDAHAVC